MTGAYRIGTSGFHYRHWRGVFYPEDLPAADWLPFYARAFDTIELNATFYKLPTARTISRWREQVPPGFTFAAKGSRYLTHFKKLTDTETGLERYFSRVGGLGAALGPILWQLPPGWRADPDRLAAFLAALPPGYRHAFEFRDPSWHIPAVYHLLERRGAALCAYHMGNVVSPQVLTADFAYLRLHGPAGPYQGNYDARQLTHWAGVVRGWAGLVETIYVYFNNDTAGFAVQNAQALCTLLGVQGTKGRAPLPG